MEAAPLSLDAGVLPDGGEARFVRAADGTRLRVATWRGGNAGTVLIFPGRTEYIEKYGHVIARLVASGYSVAVIDWRGQGLSDRAVTGNLGHVGRFTEFQQDVACLVEAARDLPGPRILLAHSMGGCIGLRALINGLVAERAVFSAPMWGLSLPPVLRVIAPFIARFLRAVGLGRRGAPGSSGRNYVQDNDFPGNVLTSDRKMFERMRATIDAHPELGLGGPTNAWLGAAFDEMESLMEEPLPRLPVMVILGEEEKVVSPAAIRAQLERMEAPKLLSLSGVRHEALMEDEATREAIWLRVLPFMNGARP